MLKKIFISLSIIAVAISSCKEDDGNPPVITFDGEGISGIFAGDDATVTGKVQADNSLSGVYWFHQKLNDGGNLDEQTGGQLDLGADGSFSIPVAVTINTIGIKIVAEDDKGNRNVAVFPIILGDDALIIAFEGDGFIASVDAGEEFSVKGTVNSGTPLTSLTYTVVKGALTEPPVNITLTGEQSSVFDFKVAARVGMTGIRIDATNRGSLATNKLFEIRRVIPSGPVILFDKEKINVKPDSVFVVSGQVVSEGTIASVSYVVYKEGGSNPAQATTLDGDKKFSFNVTANEKITAVAVLATDTDSKEGEETITVKVLYPERTESATMYHYKNIILDDNTSRDRSYFSFDVAPYVLNATQAFANYEKVQLLYTNLYLVGTSAAANTGPAIFTPSVSQGGTVKGTILTQNPNWPVTDWGTFNVGRLQAIGMESAFTSATGKTFADLDNMTQEEWNTMNAYIYNNGTMGSSGIIRQVTISNNGVGWMFKIGWGGSAPASFNRVAIGIVRSFGGTPNTQEGESTGAWLEVEIKMSKNPIK